MAQIWGLVLQWGYFWTLTRVTFWQNFTPKKKRQKKKEKKQTGMILASCSYLVFSFYLPQIIYPHWK
jgi:hypothetical protein